MTKEWTEKWHSKKSTRLKF